MLLLSLRRLVENKGSALVWSVCILLVMSVISAGVLMSSHSNYQRTLEDAYRRKAELLAQSGIIYTKQRISESQLESNIIWYPDATDFDAGVVSILPRTVYIDGKDGSENCVEISYEAIENRSGDGYLLKVTSTADCGGIIASSCGIFANEGVDEWYFVGYIG